MFELWLIAISIGFLASPLLISYFARLFIMSRLACPHCGARYGLASARHSQPTVTHILWEPGYTPRFWESPENIRSFTCGHCGQLAVLNFYGERDEHLEDLRRESA
jgi:predicted RNA-binding Zn-ribbon protein involved in translation (DUF1610 family)